MVRIGSERLIGELTIAVGISILFPSASLLWDMADDFLSRPFWSGLLIVFGAAIIYGCSTESRRWRISMLFVALIAWGGMLGVYIVNVQRTPMAFVSVVVIVRVLHRLSELLWNWNP